MLHSSMSIVVALTLKIKPSPTRNVSNGRCIAYAYNTKMSYRSYSIQETGTLTKSSIKAFLNLKRYYKRDVETQYVLVLMKTAICQQAP